MKSLPILDYRERVNFLELRVIEIEGYKTFEIVNWFDNKEDIVGYWKLDDSYELVMCSNLFLRVDSGILNKYMYKAQKMLDCYLGEIRRMEIM